MWAAAPPSSHMLGRVHQTGGQRRVKRRKLILTQTLWWAVTRRAYFMLSWIIHEPFRCEYIEICVWEMKGKRGGLNIQRKGVTRFSGWGSNQIENQRVDRYKSVQSRTEEKDILEWRVGFESNEAADKEVNPDFSSVSALNQRTCLWTQPGSVASCDFTRLLMLLSVFSLFFRHLLGN